MDPNNLRPVKDDTVYRVFKQTVEEGINCKYFDKFGEGIADFHLELFAHPLAIALENAYQDILKLIMRSIDEGIK